MSMSLDSRTCGEGTTQPETLCLAPYSHQARWQRHAVENYQYTAISCRKPESEADVYAQHDRQSKHLDTGQFFTAELNPVARAGPVAPGTLRLGYQSSGMAGLSFRASVCVVKVEGAFGDRVQYDSRRAFAALDSGCLILGSSFVLAVEQV